MAANESTKFQINYKLNDGTLINLYAATVQELETGLTDLSMVSALISSTAKELGNTPVASRPDVASIAQQFNATPVVAAAPVLQSGGHTCKHGTMSLRSGVGQKGPWSGYMCAAPKGAPDKCDTIWVR